MTLQRRDFVKYLGGAAALGATPAFAAAAGCEPRQDDLWFVNTCGVPCGRLNESHARCYTADRMTPQRTWQRSSLEQLFAEAADGRPTVFWVHGHRVNTHWAMTSGWWIYNGLVQACPTSPPPIRFVIFKWPSEGGGRPIPDARHKAGVADQTCYKLAWLLGHMPSHAPQSFVGFSYGTRVIGGAMHLTAGGNYCGYTLDQRYASRTRVVYWAGAVNYHWMAPGNPNGYAIHATDAMLNLYNCCDPVLRFHPRVTGADALGMVGMPASWLGADAFRFKQRNVCGQVNRLHLTRNYALNGSAMAATRKYLLWQPV